MTKLFKYTYVETAILIFPNEEDKLDRYEKFYYTLKFLSLFLYPNFLLYFTYDTNVLTCYNYMLFNKESNLHICLNVLK